MKPRLLAILVPLSVLLVLTTVPRADGPSDARGEVGLALMLRKLATTGTVMHATAHPDDENNGLLAQESHGQGLRVVLATATRGNGGQNEIGPELLEALGVLRTEELLAAHRFDGGEQLFGRAVDFGFSFSIEETYEKWGKAEIVDDYVRLIRMTRPDVVFTMRPDGPGGGQHHQASARITTEAFRLAGDPTKFPEQVAAGLRAWQPRKLYQMAFFPGQPNPSPEMKLIDADTNVFDPLLGKTYLEIGAEGRSMHKCQGMAQLLPLPGTFTIKYRLIDTTLPEGVGRDDKGFTDGLDLSLTGLGTFVAGHPPALMKGLGEIADAVKAADARLRASGPDAAVDDLARGLIATRAVRAWLRSSDVDEGGRYEIDVRLQQTEHKFEQALVLAQGLRIEALADDGVVVPGQKTKITLILANRGRAPAHVEHAGAVGGFVEPDVSCPSGDVAPNQVLRCEGTLEIRPDARTTEPYWHRDGEAGRSTFDADAPFGLPFRPTPFQATFKVGFSGADVPIAVPVQYRYEGNIFSGEKRMELHVVPAVTLRVSPGIAVVPRNTAIGPQRTASSTAAHAAQARGTSRTIQVTVTNNTSSATDTDVRLELPAGWSVAPATQHVRFQRAAEADTVVFTVTLPPSVTLGGYKIRAVAQSGDTQFDRGYDVIEYPHIHRQHVFEPSIVPVKVIDVELPPNLTVGYVMGVGDQVPPALEQIGARVVMLDEVMLAAGDLSRFDAIVTGVRAYERRPDLRAYNHRLLEYAERGGTVIVQYNKFEFNQAQYAPYPAKVSSNRVTDEHSPVTVLEPEHPLFNRPNRITDAAWNGWVQERGLYFLGERDSKYVDLLQLEDPFEFNKGPKRGALVTAAVGKGRWVYVGLGLWRQLPAGTDGAYQLLANLVSLSRTGKSTDAHTMSGR
jgi:LmbE family N-acetylglucosaminyl deacetylase